MKYKAFIFLFLLSCSSESVKQNNGEAISGSLKLEVLSGDDQKDVIDNQLLQPLTVRLRETTSQKPVKGEEIAFEVVSGSATVNGDNSVLTDSTGIAQVVVSFGSLPGVVEIRATVTRNKAFHVTFQLEALEIAPKRLAIRSGKKTVDGLAGETLGEKLKLVALSDHSRPVQNGKIVLEVLSAPTGTTITQSPLLTDESGEANPSLQLSEKIGEVQLQATWEVAGEPLTIDRTVQFTIQILPAKVSNIFPVTGFQVGSNPVCVGNDKMLPAPIVMRATDHFGNPISNLQVAIFKYFLPGFPPDEPGDFTLATDSRGEISFNTSFGQRSTYLYSWSNYLNAKVMDGNPTTSPETFVRVDQTNPKWVLIPSALVEQYGFTSRVVTGGILTDYFIATVGADLLGECWDGLPQETVSVTKSVVNGQCPYDVEAWPGGTTTNYKSDLLGRFSRGEQTAVYKGSTGNVATRYRLSIAGAPPQDIFVGPEACRPSMPH